MILRLADLLGVSELLAKVFASIALAGTVLAFGYGCVRAHDSNVIAKHETKIEKATSNATHTIRASGARSSDPSVQGKRDPTTKVD